MLWNHIIHTWSVLSVGDSMMAIVAGAMVAAIVRGLVMRAMVVVVAAAAAVVVRVVVVVIVVPDVDSVAAVLVAPFDLRLEMGPLSVLVPLDGVVWVAAPVAEIPGVGIWDAGIPVMCTSVFMRCESSRKVVRVCGQFVEARSQFSEHNNGQVIAAMVVGADHHSHHENNEMRLGQDEGVSRSNPIMITDSLFQQNNVNKQEANTGTGIHG